MKFVVHRTSDYSNQWSIEITSLDELLSWIHEQQESIIIEETAWGWEIEVYDKERE